MLIAESKEKSEVTIKSSLCVCVCYFTEEKQEDEEERHRQITGRHFQLYRNEKSIMLFTCQRHCFMLCQDKQQQQQQQLENMRQDNVKVFR